MKVYKKLVSFLLKVQQQTHINVLFNIILLLKCNLTYTGNGNSKLGAGAFKTGQLNQTNKYKFEMTNNYN